MRSFLGFALSLMLLSCSSEEQPPSAVLPENEMKEVIWDVLKAQTLAKQLVKADSTLNDTVESNRLTQEVFKLHKIDSKEFDKSYNWYINHPAVFKGIFDSLYIQKQQKVNELYPPGQMRKEAKGINKDRLKLMKVDTVY